MCSSVSVFIVLGPSFYFGDASCRSGKFYCVISLMIFFLFVVFSGDIQFCYLVCFLLVTFFTLLRRYFSTFIFHPGIFLILYSFFFPTSILFLLHECTYSFTSSSTFVLWLNCPFSLHGLVLVSSGFLFFYLFWFLSLIFGSFPQISGHYRAGGLYLWVSCDKAGGSSLCGWGEPVSVSIPRAFTPGLLVSPDWNCKSHAGGEGVPVPVAGVLQAELGTGAPVHTWTQFFCF